MRNMQTISNQHNYMGMSKVISIKIVIYRNLLFILLNADFEIIAFNILKNVAGVPKLPASLGHTGRRRRVVLGHTLNTQTLTKTDEQ